MGNSSLLGNFKTASPAEPLCWGSVGLRAVLATAGQWEVTAFLYCDADRHVSYSAE